MTGLFDMAPTLSAFYVGYGGSRDAELRCDSFVCPDSGSDLSNFIGAEPRIPAHLTDSKPTLSNHISNITSLCVHDEVARVYTSQSIAPMRNDHSILNRTILDLEYKPVSEYYSFITGIKKAMSFISGLSYRLTKALPHPTITGIARLYKAPKANFWRLDGCGHGGIVSNTIYLSRGDVS